MEFKSTSTYFAGRSEVLKLDFYKEQKTDETITVRKQLDKSVSLKTAGIKKAGLFEVKEGMSVKEFRKNFFHDFGVVVQ